MLRGAPQGHECLVNNAILEVCQAKPLHAIEGRLILYDEYNKI